MSGLAALARLTLRRRFRGRAIWVSVLFAIAPGLMALIALSPYRPPTTVWGAVMGIAIGLLVIVPPLHVAGAIGDEVDSHTFTYLWSRPIPRWSVLAAKLIALVPLVAGSLVLSLAIAWPISGIDTELFLRSALAIAVGAIALSATAAGIGSLVPRYPLPAAIAFLLVFDVTLSLIPFSGRSLSVSYQVRVLSGAFGPDDGSAIESLLWCAGQTVLWLSIAMWRITRAEYARSD